MGLRVAGLGDRGLARTSNEDHYLIGPVVAGAALWAVEQPCDDPRFAAEGLLCAVADGMGGHAAGELASRSALECLAQAPVNDRDPTGVWLARLARRAHERLEELSAADPRLRGMGTTLVGVHVMPGVCTVVHAGDSRCYRVRDGFMQQLTRDHAIGGEGEPGSPLTNCLGAGAECAPEIRRDVRLRAGDGLLLCSDGLTNAIREIDGLEALVAAPGPPTARVCRLVEAANAAGGPDNVTVVFIEVV
jgi:protein phosphatase